MCNFFCLTSSYSSNNCYVTPGKDPIDCYKCIDYHQFSVYWLSYKPEVKPAGEVCDTKGQKEQQEIKVKSCLTDFRVIVQTPDHHSIKR